MSKPDIYLHIGMNKTGSTAIQFWMSDKKEALVHAQFLYPEFGERGGAHYDLSKDFGFKQGKIPDIEEEFVLQKRAAFKEEINSTYVNTVLFSSEYFVMPGSVKLLKLFFAGYNVKIIVYLRRHDHWWESLYSQFVKTAKNPPMKKGIENYIDFQKDNIKYHNYVEFLDRWANEFGVENIIVRPYEKLQQPEGIVLDIAKIVGIAHLNIDFNDSKQNVSLDNHSTYILDIAQRAGLEKYEISKLLDYLHEKQDINAARSSLLSPDRRRGMIEYCSKSQYELIADKYLGRSDGRLFYEPLPEDENWQPFVPPSDEEVVATIVSALELNQATS